VFFASIASFFVLIAKSYFLDSKRESEILRRSQYLLVAVGIVYQPDGTVESHPLDHAWHQ